MEATPGQFLLMPFGTKKAKEDLQVNAKKLKADHPCRVCAKGALAVSAARLYDSIPSEFRGQKYYSWGDFMDGVTKHFTEQEAHSMEAFFERYGRLKKRIYDLAYKMNSTERLQAIAGNIIKNRGEFMISNLGARDRLVKVAGRNTKKG